MGFEIWRLGLRGLGFAFLGFRRSVAMSTNIWVWCLRLWGRGFGVSGLFFTPKIDEFWPHTRASYTYGVEICLDPAIAYLVGLCHLLGLHLIVD